MPAKAWLEAKALPVLLSASDKEENTVPFKNFLMWDLTNELSINNNITGIRVDLYFLFSRKGEL